MADPKKGVNPFAKKGEGEEGEKDPKGTKKPEGSENDPKGGEGKGELDKEKVSESLKSLFDGMEISETLVNSIVGVSVSAIEEALAMAKAIVIAEAREEFETKFDEEITTLAESVDRYLTQGVRTFIKENELAITEGLRQEAATKILGAARGICESYGLEMSPVEQTALAEAVTLVSTAQSQLDEALSREMSMQVEIDGLKRGIILGKLSEGMVSTDAERLVRLAESVDYTTDTEFSASVTTLKESFGVHKPKQAEPKNLDEGVVVPKPKNLDEGVVIQKAAKRKF